jgi:predicted nucleic acid-binding Zn ribbon protein
MFGNIHSPIQVCVVCSTNMQEGGIVCARPQAVVPVAY